MLLVMKAGGNGESVVRASRKGPCWDLQASMENPVVEIPSLMSGSITADIETTEALFQRKAFYLTATFAWHVLKGHIKFRPSNVVMCCSLIVFFEYCIHVCLKAEEMRTRHKSVSINSLGLLPQALDQSERNSYKWCIVQILSYEFSLEPFDLYADHTRSQDIPFDEWHLIYMFLMLSGDTERCSHYVEFFTGSVILLFFYSRVYYWCDFMVKWTL